VVGPPIPNPLSRWEGALIDFSNTKRQNLICLSLLHWKFPVHLLDIPAGTRIDFANIKRQTSICLSLLHWKFLVHLLEIPVDPEGLEPPAL
jgi:hypothetical protein